MVLCGLDSAERTGRLLDFLQPLSGQRAGDRQVVRAAGSLAASASRRACRRRWRTIRTSTCATPIACARSTWPLPPIRWVSRGGWRGLSHDRRRDPRARPDQPADRGALCLAARTLAADRTGPRGDDEGCAGTHCAAEAVARHIRASDPPRWADGERFDIAVTCAGRYTARFSTCAASIRPRSARHSAQTAFWCA